MEFKDFFDRYINEDITTITDVAKEAFSEPLSKAIYEEYDVAEVALEFLGHHESAKKYQEIEDFYQLLMEHNQELFLENKEYYIEALMKYHCAQGNREKVLGYLQDLLSFGYQNYDILLLIIYYALFYGYTDKVDELIEHLYNEVKNDDELIEGATIDFTLFKFSIELEKLYLAQEKSLQALDWEPFREKMASYDFELIEEFRQAIEKGLLYTADNVRGDFLGPFPENMKEVLGALQLVFMKYIHQQGCSFVVSAMIWNALLEYWVGNEASNWETFFQFEEERFTEFLQDQQGIMIDYRHMVANILWGSAYVVEFLRNIQVFDETLYKTQIQVINAIKTLFKEANNVELWQYNFVLNWMAPNDALATAQEEDKKLFADSFELTSEDQNEVHFGKLHDFLPKPSDIWGDGGMNLPPIAPSKPKVERRSHNYKRNERVTVRYQDGTIKEKVKFKTIQDDFELGACEVV